jgi:hypothetical protein
MQYSTEYLIRHNVLLNVLIAYNYDVIFSIGQRDNSEYGNATREQAKEEGINIEIVDNTLYITIEIPRTYY